MPRLFTGLEIPSAHRIALSLVQNGQPKGTRNVLRWVEPENFHITLQFIGNVTPRMADDIVETLDHQSWYPPTIELGELKSFGSAKPTSIFASIRKNEALSSLAAAQKRLIQYLGVALESRQFTPHITIARCRGASAEQVAGYLSLHGGYFTPPAFQPSRFALYSAREPNGGGPYKVEEVFALSKVPSTISQQQPLPATQTQGLINGRKSDLSRN